MDRPLRTPEGNPLPQIWNGVFPATTTKLKESGTVDLAATRSSLGRLIRNGLSGVIVLPMLGEIASVRAAREAVAGRVPLLSGLAEISPRLPRCGPQLRILEAEGLMVFPSLAYKTDLRETSDWYKAIAGTSDLPIMVYKQSDRLWGRRDPCGMCLARRSGSPLPTGRPGGASASEEQPNTDRP